MRLGKSWVVAAILALTTSSQAAILTFDLDLEFSGATPPAGAGPWLRATFDDAGSSGSVTITLTAVNLVNQEFVRFWHFNVDPAINLGNLSFSPPVKTGSFPDPVIDLSTDAFQADGDGLYDMLLTFAHSPPANRFGPGDAVQYTITGEPSLTANSFNFLSTPAGGNGPFFIAAHIQGIGATGKESGWITDVPEPASLTLVAVAALATLRRRR